MVNKVDFASTMNSAGNGVISICAASQTENDLLGPLQQDLSESTLPREFRNRLHKMFERIEREFEREYQKLCAENYALQEKLEKVEDAEHPESNLFSKKLTASHLSHRIKQQYKQSTSRLVSSLRPTSGGLSLPGPSSNPDSSRSGSWKFVHRFTGHRDGIWEVNCFRSLVATASADTMVRLWSNSDSHGCLLVYSGHSGSVNSVRFRDRDRLMLTASGDGTAHLVALPPVLFETTPAIPLPPASGDLELTGLPSDDPTGDTDNQTEGGGGHQVPLQLRDPSAVFQTATFFGGPNDNHDGGGGGGGGGSGGASSLESCPLAAADFVSDREHLVTASWDRVGHLYDLHTCQEVQSLAGHDHQLTDVRSCRDEPVVVTSARDSTFRVWDFRQTRLEVHVQQAHSRTVSTAQFLPGSCGRQIVSAGTDRCCRLWDLRSLRSPLFTVRTDARINRLAVSQPHLLPSAVEPALPTEGGTTGAAAAALGEGLGALAAAQACVLALPLDNRTIRLVAANGSRIGRIPRNTAHGHTSAITSAAWADEGQCNLFTTGFDQQLLGWQLQI